MRRTLPSRSVDLGIDGVPNRAEDNRHVALSAVRAGTVYHVSCLVWNRVPERFMQVFLEMC